MKIKTELDVHTHTIASGHAFSTLQEMAKAASDKGLKLLGITEHSSGIPGSCDPIYFRNLHVVPRQMYGIELLLGAEINILDTAGHLDMDEFYLQKLVLYRFFRALHQEPSTTFVCILIDALSFSTRLVRQISRSIWGF